ncbi:hypothetical protein [Roseibium sp. Sym1]|uniref:hypothetical protein n=1 Tax=Roseibium sp. Sym1 TaxID=3016006 RepID=UPI0022B4E3D1|nr:hypothetical protein [Roseibium sp. Sym1]
MVNGRILNVISAFIEIIEDSDEIIIAARIKPEVLDALAAAGTDLEDLEDDAHGEVETCV